MEAADLPLQVGPWHLISVVTTEGVDGSFVATNYCSHGGCNSGRWWGRSHCSKSAHWMSPQLRLDILSLSWDVSIYINTALKDGLDARVSYMDCLGFQTKLRCSDHKLPLAPVSLGLKLRCAFCSKKANLVCCASDACGLAVCRAHEKEHIASEDSVVELSLPEELAHRGVDDDNGADGGGGGALAGEDDGSCDGNGIQGTAYHSAPFEPKDDEVPSNDDSEFDDVLFLHEQDVSHDPFTTDEEIDGLITCQ